MFWSFFGCYMSEPPKLLTAFGALYEMRHAKVRARKRVDILQRCILQQTNLFFPSVVI
jgi:hypothetical protein